MEEKEILKKIEQLFLKKRGFLFKIPKKDTPVILLFSGGFDSSLLWFLLVKKYKLTVYPVFFYNNFFSYFLMKKKIKKIESFFKKNYSKQFIPVEFIKITNLFSFSQIDKKLILKDLSNILPNLIKKDKVTNRKNFFSLINVPGRIWLFLFYAHQLIYKLRYKIKKDINTIFVGFVPEDTHSLFEATLTQLRALTLNFCLFLKNFRWQVIAPIEKNSDFFYSKKDLLTFALKYNFPVFQTWSCVNSLFIHCGQCYNCYTRKKTFESLKIRDKTFYSLIIRKKLLSFLKDKTKNGVFFIKKTISLIKKTKLLDVFFNKR